VTKYIGQSLPTKVAIGPGLRAKGTKMKKVAVLLALSFACTSFADQIPQLQKRIDTAVKHYWDKMGYKRSVQFARGEAILFSKGYGYSNFEHKTPITIDTPFRLASLTKQFTATAILILEQQGRLDLNDPLSTYLPEFKGSIGDTFTIENMMNHTSGLVRDIEEISDLNISERYVKVADIIGMAKNSTLRFKPGSRFGYSNVGFSLLAAVIERVTGMPYKQALNQLIFSPHNLAQTAHDDYNTIAPGRASGYLNLSREYANAPYENKSYVIGAGSIMSSAQDMFRWSRALFRGNVLTSEQRDKITHPKRENYSLGWFTDPYDWEDNGETQTGVNINHDGGSQGFSSQLTYLQEHDITIVLLTNIIPNKIHSLNDYIVGTVTGKSLPLPKADMMPEIIDMLWREGTVHTLTYMDQLRAGAMKDQVPASFDFILTGRGYKDVHRDDEAMQIFEFVALDRPNWEYGHLFQGLIFAERGQYNEAYCAFTRSMTAAPKSSNARSEIAKISSKITDRNCTTSN
jgi:CubicO group peptidase (beta-lactamase class C family)